MTVPGALAGRRTRLRPLKSSDAAALAEALEATRAALKRRFRWAEAASRPGVAEEFIRGCAEAAASGRRLVFGVFEAKGERLLGVAALDRTGPEEVSRAEASVWIRAGEQDKGYATEAGRLLVDCAFKHLGLRRLYSRIDPANRGGRKVLQRLGFRYEGCLREDKRLNGRWIDQECWGALRSERRK